MYYMGRIKTGRLGPRTFTGSVPMGPFLVCCHIIACLGSLEKLCSPTLERGTRERELGQAGCAALVQVVLALEIEYWHCVVKRALYIEILHLFPALWSMICYGEW